jgi:hypothetical protein
MSIEKITTPSTLAAVYRRANSVVFTTPAEGVSPFVMIVEEDVISDADGTRYSRSESSLFGDIDVSDPTEFVLYDTSGVGYVHPEFDETTVSDLMAMDNSKTTDMPVKGKFTNQDIADLLFSMYICLSEQRANPPEPVEPETAEDPDGGTE